MLVNREKSSNFLERRTNVNEHPVNDSHGIRIGISSHHWKTPANQIRAFLLERGMVFAQRPAKLKAVMAGVLENADADLTPRMRSLIDMLWSEWKLVEEQIKDLDLELERISASDAGCTRIRQIPGIGPVTATAIVAAIGNGAGFRKGREG